MSEQNKPDFAKVLTMAAWMLLIIYLVVLIISRMRLLHALSQLEISSYREGLEEETEEDASETKKQGCKDCAEKQGSDEKAGKLDVGELYYQNATGDKIYAESIGNEAS